MKNMITINWLDKPSFINKNTDNKDFPTICEIGKERIRRAEKKSLKKTKTKIYHL